MREVEQADGIRIGYCATCNMPHLLLLDENGEVFAEAIIGASWGLQMIEALRAALYQQAALKDEKQWPKDEA
jgi:hypothetical protein